MRAPSISTVFVVLAAMHGLACSSESPGGSDGSGASGDDDASGAGATGSGSGGSASGGGGSGPSCTAETPAGFSEAATPYALPAPRCNSQFDELAGTGSELRFALADLAADRRPDLVVHQDTCDTDVGTKRWDAYAGGAEGFAAVAPLTLPAPRCQTSFDELGGYSSALRYALLDLTADGRSDLVVYRDDCDADIGALHWDLYAGSDQGFAASPQPFAVPTARCQTSFDELAGSSSALRYALLDTNGDARPDLVVYRDECDAAVGESRWDVYLAGADGFAAAPSPLSIPAARCQASFDELAGTSSSLRFALLDMTADARPDLLVYRDQCDAAVGTSRWDVYALGADGFAASPSPLSIPAPRCQTSFDELAGQSSSLRFALLDMSGDRRPDLLVHRDACDAAVGTERWDLYAGGVDGFAAQPSAFHLPAPRCQASFDELAGTSSSLRFALLDATADCRPDLVVYRDECEADIGTARWDLYVTE